VSDQATPGPGRSGALAVLAVLVGGAAGSSLRLSSDLLLPHGADAFPLGTLLINIVGSLALGFLAALVWPTAPGWLRAGLGPGLLGSFTTFSAIAVSVVQLAKLDAVPLALAYLAATLAGGLAAAALGIRLGSGGRTRVPEIGADA